VGRIAGIVDGKAQISASLRNLCNLADLKMTRLLDTIDEVVIERGLEGEVGEPQRYEPIKVEDSPSLSLDLTRFSSVIWATGYRPDYSWLHARVLDLRGRLRHDAGMVTGAPGLYRIGLNMLRRRKSSFIHGAEDDARDITDHLAAYLGVGAPV
jgi:putative flavoprotein involved in K+ transport